MTFKFNARYALLTYAQCGELDPWRVVECFTLLRGECIVAREAHANDGTHLHAFVDFGRQRTFRRPNVFDVDGHHPNISPTHSTPQAGFDYACKDGDIVAGGLARPDGSQAARQPDRWPHVIAAPDREEFMRRLMEHYPRVMVSSFGSVTKYCDWKYRVDPDPYTTPQGISFDTSNFPQLDEWASTTLGTEMVG